MEEIEAKVESEMAEEQSKPFFIPPPYRITNNKLIRVSTEKVKNEEVEVETIISRLAPTITKEFSNMELNSVYYEIVWMDRGRERREVVPAVTLATKKELLTLADKGFSCNDLNAKNLIDYFNKYLMVNESNIERAYMVERLGHIKKVFIHPLASEGIEIIPTDIGEKQLLEGFEVKGTIEGWISQVFDKVKNHPKVLFLTLSSFASVMLHDLKINSFITDLSGGTSQGKTTGCQVARSVWGNKALLNEWNITKVSIERKAGFLNSFPLYMDDTRKADERTLQSIVYQFSGGRAKGRGTIKGSQMEITWQNILVSTGEVSLTNYAPKAGGVSARVITLTGAPFGNEVDYEYFSTLYESIDEHYGLIGLEFLKKWKEQKEAWIPLFRQYKSHYMNKSKGNEVLTRLSLYYAVIHFAGSVVKKMFNLDVDLKRIDDLFDESAEQNKSIDKPRELLEEILLYLDSNRKDIYYEYEPASIKAIYKYDTICLTPSFIKSFLGVEEKVIREEWLKRGFTEKIEQQGKTLDYKQIKHKGRKFNAVVVKKAIIKEFDLDFETDLS